MEPEGVIYASASERIPEDSIYEPISPRESSSMSRAARKAFASSREEGVISTPADLRSTTDSTDSFG
jgi:hypothetical protein